MIGTGDACINRCSPFGVLVQAFLPDHRFLLPIPRRVLAFYMKIWYNRLELCALTDLEGGCWMPRFFEDSFSPEHPVLTGAHLRHIGFSLRMRPSETLTVNACGTDYRGGAWYGGRLRPDDQSLPRRLSENEL